jgi:hypothetical protein
VKDGKYIVYETRDGKEVPLGHFEIRSGTVSFPSDADRLNIDRFPAGPMSKHTKDRIELYMSGRYKGLRVEEEQPQQPVKKFGENNSV